MQLGLMSTVFGSQDVNECFEQAAKVGAQGLEPVCREAKALVRGDYASELKGLAKKHGVEVSSLSLGFLTKQPSLIGSEEIISQAQVVIRKGLCVAGEVGAGVILIPFFGKNTIDTEAELTQAVTALDELIEDAESANVIIGIETNLKFSRQRFLLNCLGNTEYVKCYCDTGNALGRKEDVATGIRNLGIGGIAQVHFKDVLVSEGHPPDYNVALGEGDVDFRAVVQALKAVGYDGWIIIETPPTDDPLGSAAANLEFAHKIIGA